MKKVLNIKWRIIVWSLLMTVSTFFSSCSRREPIPQSELTGIWKLNGYTFTTYKMEITQDGYFYWWNYNDWFNRVEEFQIRYDMNRNTIRLTRPGQTFVRYHITVVR
jgi:hypothetical protein